MFPLIHAGNETWSPAQVELAWRHPLVRSVPVLTGGRKVSVTPVGVTPNPSRGDVRIEWASPSGAGDASGGKYPSRIRSCAARTASSSGSK